mgnify:CR=1 FL=1
MPSIAIYSRHTSQTINHNLEQRPTHGTGSLPTGPKPLVQAASMELVATSATSRRRQRPIRRMHHTIANTARLNPTQHAIHVTGPGGDGGEQGTGGGHDGGGGEKGCLPLAFGEAAPAGFAVDGDLGQGEVGGEVEGD